MEKEPLPGPPILAKGLRRYETPVPLLTEAVTRIWIEPLRHPDGLPDIILGASSIALVSVDLGATFWSSKRCRLCARAAVR